MKKRMIPVAVILALCLSLFANASARSVNDFDKREQVTVSGTKATCQLTVNASQVGGSASIKADIGLEVKNGSSYTRIVTWSTSGTRTLNFSKSFTDSRISSGNCRMYYSVTVNGRNGSDTVSGYVYG